MMRALATGMLVAALAASSVVARADDPELAVVVHPAVGVRALSTAELEAIFTSTMQRWPDGKSIIPFAYAPEDPVRRLFDRVVLRMGPEEVGRFWVDQRIRGGAAPPRRAPSPRLAARVVARLPGSIAYVPVADVGAENVRIVARVRGGVVVPP